MTSKLHLRATRARLPSLILLSLGARDAHPVIRCPKCSKLVVRDVARCECGHIFDGTEPDAIPTPQDAAEWQRIHGESGASPSPPSSPGSTALRVAVLLLALGLVVLVGPGVIQSSAGSTRNWSGSLLPFIVLPVAFAVLWLLFSFVSVGSLVVRDGSRISVLACIGISLLLALVGIALISARLPAIPSYGHGP